MPPGLRFNMNPRTCDCGRPITRNRTRRCAYCAAADPHRHAGRQMPEMFVSVDSETKWSDTENRQVMVSLSYGREDGTSGSTVTGSAMDMFNWLIDQLAGHHLSDGKVYRQATVAFHFGHDTAVLTNNLNPANMFLVRKAQEKIRTALCGSAHRNGEPCEYERSDDTDGLLHRYNPLDVQAVITDGMHGDVIAYHPDSHLAMASCPGQGIYLEHRPHGDRYEEWRRLIIRDTGKSFPGGLEAVIEHWNPELSEAQRDIIAWGKQARTTHFEGADLARIAAYSESECVAHARVCRKLLNALESSAQVRMLPSKLAGSGSVAAATMKHYGVAKRRETWRPDDTNTEEVWINDLARLTYFGGLIEGPVVGLVAEVDEEDINSAYPSQMINIPCMRAGHGEWVTGEDIPDVEIGHALITWDLRDAPETSTPPFTVRRKTGAVCQPLMGLRQWVSLAELQTAVTRYDEYIHVHKITYWRPDCDCEPPFFFLKRLYEYRREVKEAMKSPATDSIRWWELSCIEQAIKLIINSIYGKLAQMKHGPGPFTNLHYASYITGATRAQLRRKTWEREAEGATVVYQHTDSVLSTGGNVLDGGPALGAWGREKSTRDLLIIQPGMVLPLGSNGKMASRGANTRDFALAAWNWYQQTDLTQPPADWPKLVIKQTVMVSRKQAIARGKPNLAGSFEEKTTENRVASSKRGYGRAISLPGNPQAWIIPPPTIALDAVTGIEDVRKYQSELARRRKQGEFDHELPKRTAQKM